MCMNMQREMFHCITALISLITGAGWLLSIPLTSKNKDLAWDLITLVLQPKILAPFHQEYGLLPTQISIGEGSYSTQLNQTVPYYYRTG
jgi:ABC-type glycerol-3-phosphate transport system substrate-binding protein